MKKLMSITVLPRKEKSGACSAPARAACAQPGGKDRTRRNPLYCEKHRANGERWGGAVIPPARIGFTAILEYSLSFLLAVRARDIGEAKAGRFLKEVGLKVVSHPVTFLLPGFE